MTDRSRWFVSADWLADRLDDRNIVIVDGSWHLPTFNRDASEEYRAVHIPGAVFFDIDRIADTANPLPHMLPLPEAFAEAVGAMGIDENQRIVVYDGVGLSSAPRVWWTFKAMGAADVVILEGGFQRWRDRGGAVESGSVVRAPRQFTPRFDAGALCGLGEVRANLGAMAFQLVDARPAARFFGEAPEPRPWVKSGRIPGSFNVPSTDLVSGGRLKDDAALRAAFAAAGVDLARPVVTSCGSGVTAATLSLALDILGVTRSALYDGSWTEWGGRDDLPIASGR